MNGFRTVHRVRATRKTLLAVASIVAATALAGCATVEYLWQGFRGQAELVLMAAPVDTVLADPGTGARLRDRLERAAEIRAFASAELGLPDNGSYRRYVDLKRAFVVWNVVATAELSLEARQWCYPVVGCVSYRGYFAEADARAEAAKLAAAGYDVTVSGVPAYSTLGYLADPLLNTFVDYPDDELARLIFHELSHQVVYVPDDTTFNESYATAVEEEGVRRWLRRSADRSLQERFDRGQTVRREFQSLVARTREALAAVYSSALSDSRKREEKHRLLAAMREEYEQFRLRWGGYRGYDDWMARGVNNASFALFGLYTDGLPAFRALLSRLDGDLGRFHAEVRSLAQLPKPERDRRLAGSP